MIDYMVGEKTLLVSELLAGKEKCCWRVISLNRLDASFDRTMQELSRALLTKSIILKLRRRNRSVSREFSSLKLGAV